VLVDAAVNVTAVPVSAIAQGAPVIGRTTVPLAGIWTVRVLETPAEVKLMVALSVAVPDMTSCHTRALWPAEEATRLAEPPVPAAEVKSVGKD
jgi:hypothetical protein